MDASDQFSISLLLCRLCIRIPVHIGEAPEKGLIPQFFCHRKILCTVFALRWSVILCHLLSGHFLKQTADCIELFLKRLFVRDCRHIRMMIGVISHRVSLCNHPFDQFRRTLQKMSHDKKSSRCIVFFECIQNCSCVAILIAAVKCEIDHLFLFTSYIIGIILL